MPTHIAKNGQSFSDIAKQYFGQKDLAKYVAEINQKPLDSPLSDGQEIKLPTHLYSMGRTEKGLNGPILNLNFHKLKTSSEKTIRLLDEHGNPVPGANYVVLVNDKEIAKGQLNSVGTAEIEIKDDNYSIKFTGM
jgi:hypothetical protein